MAGEASGHDDDHGPLDHRSVVAGQSFVVPYRMRGTAVGMGWLPCRWNRCRSTWLAGHCVPSGCHLRPVSGLKVMTPTF
jgi:hypothetical protein